MNGERNWKPFVVVNGDTFVNRSDTTRNITEDEILGIVQAEDKNEAQDTASGVFPGVHVFVLSFDEASPELVTAAKQKGVKNTSQGHRPGFASENR